MNCRDAQHQLTAERDGTLDNHQRAELEQHVAQCATCRSERAHVSAAIDAWRLRTQAARVPDSTREWEALRRTIRADGATGAKRSRPLFSWVALPLGAAAALMLTLWMNPSAPSPSTPAAVAARSGDSVEVSAADGSVVFVDDKSGWVVIWEAPPPARQI